MAVDLMELARQNAEEGRNYQNAFQGAGQYGAPGTSGGEGGAGYSYDANAALPAVGWEGPAAYNMQPAGQTFTPGNEAMMYAALEQARRFDPNATLTQGVGTTGEGGSIEQPIYTLNYDQSKVPAPVHPGLAPVGQYGSNESVWNNDLLYNDPNYGVMTDPRNLRGKNMGFDWLSLAPLAVAAFAGFGAPALAAYAAGAGTAGAGATAGGLTAAELASLGGAESSLYGAPVLADATTAFGATPTSLAAGSAEASLYGPEIIANPSQAVGSYAPGYGQNAWGQTVGRTAVNVGQQLGNKKFDPFSLAPVAAGAAGAPWWTAPAVGGGRAAYNYFNQPDQPQQQQQGYNPQNFGNNYGGVNPQDYGSATQQRAVNPDSRPVATSFADDHYYRFGGGGG